MSQANSRNIVPPQDSSRENCVCASLKGDGQGKNHVIHLHVGNKSCNSLESSLFHKRRVNSFDCVNDEAELGVAVEDDDSGLQESPCKVSSINCTSHSDSIYGDSEEDRPGSFDYMPSQSHVRITHSFNPPYDEEVKIDSSTGGSSIESPRSETSVTQDEYNLAEEGTEMATLSYKETPYSFETERKHCDDCWDYVPSKKRSDDEDMEDEENERNRLRNLITVSSFMSVLPRSMPSQFDQSISYGLKQLEGNGSGHLNPRITFTSYNQDQYKSEDNREKEDKKKNKSKDDTDKPEVSGLVDVNGNPRTLDIANNPQMRQLPRGKSENAALGSLAIPQSHSSSIADTNTLDRKKERKRMKLERQKWTPAEAYEDHKEFRDIKDILDFVEGGPISSSKAEGKQVKKKQERSRKKDHHLNGTITFEDIAGGEDGPNPAESVAITATGRAGLDAMGNSFVKPLGETKIIPRTDSTEDIFDKNIEFHDCLNTLPTQIVISNTVNNQRQSDSFECIQKCSNSDEADKNDSHSKVDDFTDESVTDKNKILSKKSTKTKGKNDKQGSTKENGPLSLKVNMVKCKEGLDMKDVKDSFLVKSVPRDNSNSFHSTSDTEIPPENKREDSFTEVKKRKKRLGGNIASVHHSSASTYRVHNSSGHTHRNNPRPRPVTPPLHPMMGMITSVGNSRSLPVTDQTHSSRDLSPSAFPVLLGHSPLTPHADNRRNSCGDLSSDFIDNKTYDSDRESAKSLPDAHRTRIGGDLSPGYPMSYARIAAAPRRNDCTNSPSSESGVASGSQNSSVSSSVTHTPGSSIDIMSPQSPSSTVGMSDRKATIWKGSPRERRHSIGSGPEDKAEKEKSGVAQCSRQCGSQEVLSRDSVVSARAGSTDTATPPLPAGVLHNSESTNSLQSDLDIQEAALRELENLVYHKPKHGAHPAQTKAPVRKLPSENNLPNNTSSLTQEVLRVEAGQQNKQAATFGSSDTEQKVASNVTTPDPNQAKNEIPHGTAAILSVVRAIPTGDNNVNIPSSKDKIACNSLNVKKTGTSTKSVIFLDKRFSSSPQNLGITFGFDSSYESVCEPASQSASLCQQPSKPQSAPVSSLDTVAGLFAQHMCPRQAHIPPTDSTASISSDHPCCHASSPYSDNSNLVPKGPHIQGLCNGLILPSSAAGNTVVLQEHSVSSSISDSSENAVTNLASSNRTSLSKLQPEAQTDHRIATPSSSVLPRELSNLLPVVPNGSLAEMKSTPHITTGTACVAVTRANPVDVIYSPNHPPPPLPPRMVTVTGDTSNTSNSTSSLPSRHDSIPESVQPSRCIESSMDKLAANNMPPAMGGESVDAESAVEINKALSLQSKTEALLQKQLYFAAPAEIVPFVYGEKIKPATGCGKLMFVLNNISQMSKDTSAEAASFLRKKWLDGVSHTRGSNAFATLNQD